MEQSIKRLRRIFHGMKNRCGNPNDPNYHNYGGRGVKICDAWLNSVDKFIVWALSNGYDNTLSIDRIDVNGDYDPSNCRWVDMKIQSNNRRHYWLPENYPDFAYEGLPDELSQKELRESIKARLVNNTLTQVWLINRLEEEGLNTDKTELSSVLAGTRHGAKAETLLKFADSILSRYESHMSSL